MFTTTNKLDAKSHSQARLTALMGVKQNFMPLAWHMPVSRSPFRYAIAVRDENHSYDFLHEFQEFSLNFLDISYIQAYEYSGQVHGRDEDKFKATGLTPKKAQIIRSTLIEEAYMIYECKVVDILNYGDHDVFIADVVCIHNKDVEDISPTLFLGKGFYETTSKKPLRIERK
jgi:flavin reductase (DIM6/NTAB) family NADH-FMN oxidoreductase RutF